MLALAWCVVFTPPPAREARIQQVAGTSAFSFADWETVNLSERFGRLLRGLVYGSRPATQSDVAAIRTFVESNGAQDRQQAEVAAEHAIGEAYQQAGLVRQVPLLGPRVFPPPLVALTDPPNMLIIAPLNALVVAQSVPLSPGLTTPEAERMEEAADSNGVSSLVVPIGGVATYPSMVEADGGSATDLLSAVAHEWLHEYLIFFPLGQGYWSSGETRDINETTAQMVGEEVGASVAQQLGLASPSPAPTPRPPSSGGFDFTAFMRQTRLQVEQMLDSGDVSGAEAYMNARRDELQTRGYNIRKLNQAYFAFYGSYEQSAAGSPRSPIPGLLTRLRAESGSLSAFIQRVRDVTTIQQLRAAVEDGSSG